MAKRSKDLGQWELVLDLDEEATTGTSSPVRRSRRYQDTVSKTVLRHKSDNLTIQVGDAVMMNLNGQQRVALISELNSGLKKFLEMRALLFLYPKEIVNDDKIDFLDNEIFITPETTDVMLKDVEFKVTVMGQKSLTDPALYICRRASDKTGRKLSDEFDYLQWQEFLVQDPAQAELYILERTSVLVSPRKAKKTTRTEIRPSTPTKRRIVSMAESSSDSDEFERSEASDSDSDSDGSVASQSRSRVAKPSPLPRKNSSRGNRVARDENTRTKVALMSLALNKHFKVKSGALASSLPSLKRSSDVQKSNVDTSSEAFRELKEKLHANARILLLPGREDEFAGLYAVLESAIGSQTGCCVYVSGTPGTGKTATIREVVHSLQELAQQDYLNDFDYLEINCLKLLAPGQAYERLYEYLENVKVTGANAALLLEKLFAGGRGEHSKPTIVLMDELDQIVAKSLAVLYNFFNWPTYANSKLIVVAVANTMDLPERSFETKVASRLGLRRLQFPGYSFEQLGAIITDRLLMLSEQHRRKVTVSADAVGFALRKVASVSGDARRVLAICRRAVEIAEEEYLSQTKVANIAQDEQSFSIQIKHISSAINETVNSPVAQTLATLSFTLKLVIVGVLLRMRRLGLAEVPLGDVVDEMRNSLALRTAADSTLRPLAAETTVLALVTVNGLHITRTAHLVAELEEHGILVQQNVRSERHRLIALNISEDEARQVLKRDPDVGDVLGG